MARNFQGLRVQGDAIVDPSGTSVILRGVGLGGWMNMENFITGYPANESAMREAVASVLGSERADAFFERLLDQFFTADDAEFLASLGVNCVRLPINQRHFESDAEPFKWLSRGFERLAAVVAMLGDHGI
jgi:endoglucanase